MSRRAVVTGGAGFVGSHLCEGLAKSGWTVFSLDDYSTGAAANLERGRAMGVEAIAVDITTPDFHTAMMQVRPQVVFHLAALSSVAVCERDPRRCAAVNVEGTARVLESARRSGAEKLVNVSSLAVLGVSSERNGASYGRSKKAAEQHLAREAPGAGIRLVTLRPANVYGPRQYGDGESAVVATWFGAIRKGEPVFLDGDGRQTRDFLYVEDATEAMIRSADGADGHTLDLGGGVETSLLSLLETMCEVTDWRGQPHRRPARPGDIRRSVVDPRPAEDQLGWKAQTDLLAGLRLTWKWMAGG